MNPVLILGAGPVGMTAALLLARWRVPVILLDAKTQQDPGGSRAICQQRDVLDTWSAVGCGEIAVQGLAWTTARTYHAGRELFSWTFPASGAGLLPPCVNISQTRTEQILAARVAQVPLIDVRWDHEVTGIAQDDDQVTVTCANGERLTSLYAIVCTGTGTGTAALRAALGIGFPGRTFGDRFLICDVRADMPERAAERHFIFDPPWNPGRQVLIHPCPGSVFRIDCQVPGDEPGSPDWWIRHVTGNRPFELVWQSFYRFHSRVATRMRAGRVLLAGDSAHLFSPFGARGLNSGVPDAENAAWKLAFVLNGWAPPSLLDSYETERRAAALENQQVTDVTMRFMVPQTSADRRARDRILAAAGNDQELAARTVESGRFAEPFWYTDSPLTTPDPDRVWPGRPPRGQRQAVVPGVLVPDAPLRAGRRFRELVRDGILAIHVNSPHDISSHIRKITAAPHDVLDLRALDRTGELTAALNATEGDVFLIRPDGHIAAIRTNPGPAEVTAAVSRVLGFAVT